MPNKQERLHAVQDQMAQACARAGRHPGSITLVAVSKTKHWKDVCDFIELGIRDFGENYIQEAMPKIEAVKQQYLGKNLNISWHFIGLLQSNKAKLIPGNFSVLQTLASESVAKKLDAAGFPSPFPCYVQVNISAEKTKSGIAPEELEKFLTMLNGYKNISVLGLMCIPEPMPGESSRPAFAALRELREKANTLGWYRQKIPHLSMGMSHDFQEAIVEGSTVIRVGTSLFGERA